MRQRLAPLVLAVAALTAALPARAADDAPPPPLDTAVATRLAATLEEPLPAGVADDLIDAAVLAQGDEAPLLAALAAIYDGDAADDAARTRALQIAALTLYRRGSLNDALALTERLRKTDGGLDVALRRAELLDALGRRDDAHEAYREIAERSDAGDVQARLRLRLALLDEERRRGDAGRGGSGRGGMTVVVRAGGSRAASKSRSRPPTEAAATLVAFATEDGRDVDLRRRSAILLGMLGYAAQAGRVAGAPEDDAGFRESIRRAEWALAAEDWTTAEDLAWASLERAELRRDRTYGLSVLVEAYRGADALDALIDRLQGADALGTEGRTLWIELLRETGRYDDALRLFRAEHAEDLDVAVRRQILELQRQTGDLERLVAAYREQIAAEPERVEWREGLSRHYLEQGDTDAARSVWSDPAPTWTGARRLVAAEALGGLGLDELAVAAAEACAAEDVAADGASGEALLFLARLHASRGRFEDAAGALDRLDARAAPGSPIRMSLAEALEKLGRKDRAAEVLAAVLAARSDGGLLGAEDVEMHLAWLLGELGRDDEALARWRGLWTRVESVPRRRYVEDRMMTTASRLGTLADIVVDLEDALVNGTAGARESGLLVRIYTKVGDSVSATEVIDEHLKTSGGDALKALTEKAFVYLACTDYAHYEETLERLIALDPDDEPDYLQQLAMSKLERGRHDEARKVLRRLQQFAGGGTAGLEFEAGVLALAGLRDEAARAYRRGIAGRPENIDSFLLLANVLKDLGRAEEAVGMFQYLVAQTAKDDLFTVAIDGLLNMEAPPPVLEWARRAVYERIATREDKVYLHRLAADLSEELGDTDGMLRAVETALPIAGEQRGPFLRELMDIAMQRGLRGESLRFGRRLLASDDLVPPQVYLDLGEALLADGDVAAAEKTFSRAADVPDQESFRRKVADSFEKAGFVEEALRAYQRVLVGRNDDAGLLVKVAELYEQLGRDDRAVVIHRRAVDALLLRRPFAVADKTDDEDDKGRNVWWAARNVDDFDEHYPRALRGWLTTVAPDAALAAARADHELVRADLTRVAARAGDPAERRLDGFPRVRDRAGLVRRTAIAFGAPRLADDVDIAVLQTFPGDSKLLDALVRERLAWGRPGSARALLDGCGRPEKEIRALRWLVGGDAALTPGVVPLAEAARRILPLWRDGDDAALRELLARADLAGGDADALNHIPALLWTALGLKDPDLTLLLGRAWLRLAAKNAQTYEVERQADLVIGRSAALLSGPQLRSLAMTLVDIVRDEPEKYVGLVAFLPRLQERFAAPLLTAEQALALVEVMAEKRSWGMGELLRIIPPEETLEAVRTAVDKTPESRRALVLPQLLGGLERPAGEQLSAYALRVFEEGLSGVQDEWWLRSLLANTSVRDVANLPLFARFAEILLARHPEVVQATAARVTYLAALGNDDEAMVIARDLFRAWLAKSDQDWQWRNAVQQVQDALLPAHRAAFLAVFDEVESQSGASASLAAKRLDFLQRDASDEEMLAATKAAWEQFPDDEQIRDRRVRALQSFGLRHEAIRVLAAAAEKKPRDETLVARIEAEWRALGHDPNALAAHLRRAAIEAKDAAETPPRETGERLPPPNVTTLRDALEKGDTDLARTTFRRMWRMFNMDPRFASMWSGRNLDNLWWPYQRTEPTGTPSRGALEGFLEREPGTPIERRTVYDELAERGVAVDEMRRLALVMEPGQVREVRNLHAGLATAAAKEGGVPQALADVVARIASGAGDVRDEALLLALLEQHPESVDVSLRATLDQLTAATDPLDGTAILQLARIHARAGEQARAEQLYRWCAYLSSAAGVWGTGNLTSLDARSLVDKALEDLSGDDLANFVDTLRVCADPGASHWGRDGFETLMLETWAKAGGPQEALRRGADIVANVTDTTFAVKQGTAKVAAGLLAETGRNDEALRCLEFAVTRAEPSVEMLLLPPWERQRRMRGGYLNWIDVQRLFSPTQGDWKPPRNWLAAAADALSAWTQGDRIDEDLSSIALAILAVRLHEAGDTERPARLRAQLEGLAGDEPNAWLWIADLDRRLGDEAAARGIEDRLLERGVIYTIRIPEILRRVAATEGPAVALERGEAAFAWTAREEFVKTMIDVAAQLGDEAVVAKWKERLATVQAATKALEAKD